MHHKYTVGLSCSHPGQWAFMKQEHPFARAYLLAIDFVLPFPMTALMYFLWYRRTGSSPFALYTLLLGVLFGYILPGLGTNLFKLWKFNGPFRMMNYYVHQGFMYAPYLSLMLYTAFPPGTPLTSGNIVRIVLCGAFIQSVVSCHHDICGVTTGMIEVNNTPAKLKKSPVEIITESCVVGFACVGGSFTLSCLIAYSWIVERRIVDGTTFSLLLIAGFSIMSFAMLPFAIMERRNISWEWAARFRTKKNGQG
jgi:hypothetical protein